MNTRKFLLPLYNTFMLPVMKYRLVQRVSFFSVANDITGLFQNQQG